MATRQFSPSKIVCVGRNYRDHAKELGNHVPKEPLLFLKPPSSLLEPGAPIVLPPESGQVEFEGEIGVVLGRRLRRASEEEARGAIRGVAAVNDVTARDLQKSDSQWTRAKGFDTFCPVGPLWEGALDLEGLTVITRVNGQERQRARASEMVFPIPAVLAYISRVMTLEPGDLVLTGTPAGVGKLNPGDTVEVQLADRFSNLPEYVLARIPARKKALLEKGVDVIDLGAGDADLSPPPQALDTLASASRQPAMQRYGFGLGLPAYREACSAFMQKRFGFRFDPYTEVVPLIGSKEGITHLAFAYMETGSVGIIPEPGYNSYQGGTLLAGGEAYRYALRPRTNFLVDLDEIPADVLKRARILYLNYPNNPTAAIAPKDYLERVVRRCRELDLLLVYDNAYSELAFDGYVPPSIFEIDGARDVAIEFHSCSKTFNMTGWRLGWAVAKPEIAGALAKVKSFVDTGQFMAVQAAGAAALAAYDEFVPGNVEVFRQRRDAAVSSFRAAGFQCETPKATMYLWIPLPEGVPSAYFAERLMEDEGVIVLPGSGFGAGGEGFFRISFITSPERIAEAAVRAGRVLASLEARV